MFPPDLRTDRLRLHRLAPDTVDLPTFHAHTSSEGYERVVRYVTKEPHATLGDTRAYLRTAAEEWERGEHARYAIRPRAGEDGAGEVAGAASLVPAWDRGSARLGVWFRERFWGRGYAAERGTAMLSLAFDHLDLDLVAVGCDPRNEQSRRAIRKYVDPAGGGHDGTFRDIVPAGDEVWDLERFSVTRAAWEAADRPAVTVCDGVDATPE